MERKQNSRYPKSLQFKVEASKCDLRIGDSVTPDTVVGTELETGNTLKAGCHGKVVAVDFSGGEHALTVHISVMD
ncbi:MAG: hypothetical protein AB1641_08015 [Thermodesulfobacteriota bacterium]